MRVMLTGGGTGGHTSPAVAVLESLRARVPDLKAEWVGRRGGIEERVSMAQTVPFRAVPVEGWPRKRGFRQLYVAGKLAAGVAISVLHLLRFKPDVVFGVGGYVSLPLGLAAQRLGVPVVLHEQNKRLGMANRLLAPRAALIFTSYPDTLGSYPKDRAQITGNPVRAAFLRPPERDEARKCFELKPYLPTILVCGGSQGARSVNNATREAIQGFRRDEAQFIWMTGRASHAECVRAALEFPKDGPFVQVHEFIDDMAAACVASDLVVGRAGASTIAELTVLGKPAILIPFPNAAENHQEANARALEAEGAAWVLNDAECTGDRLAGLIRGALADREKLAQMGAASMRLAQPDAAGTIAEAIIALKK